MDHFSCGVYRSFFFFSSRRRHTRFKCDWSSDVCSSDLHLVISRHNEGGVKYGAFSFMGKNMYEEAAAELADLCNYARYAYIKLRLIEMQTADLISDAPAEQKLLHGFKPSGS